VASAFYAPFRVLSLKTDLDPTKPGLQTQVQVGSLPGWTVEILRTTSGAIGEQPIGMFVVGSDGLARAPVTLPDGLGHAARGVPRRWQDARLDGADRARRYHAAALPAGVADAGHDDHVGR